MDNVGTVSLYFSGASSLIKALWIGPFSFPGHLLGLHLAGWVKHKVLLGTVTAGCNVVLAGLRLPVSIPAVAWHSYNLKLATLIEVVLGVSALILIQVMLYLLLLYLLLDTNNCKVFSTPF